MSTPFTCDAASEKDPDSWLTRLSKPTPKRPGSDPFMSNRPLRVPLTRGSAVRMAALILANCPRPLPVSESLRICRSRARVVECAAKQRTGDARAGDVNGQIVERCSGAFEIERARYFARKLRVAQSHQIEFIADLADVEVANAFRWRNTRHAPVTSRSSRGNQATICASRKVDSSKSADPTSTGR